MGQDIKSLNMAKAFVDSKFFLTTFRLVLLVAEMF